LEEGRREVKKVVGPLLLERELEFINPVYFEKELDFTYPALFEWELDFPKSNIS
jgi:hypothetical protein